MAGDVSGDFAAAGRFRVRLSLGTIAAFLMLVSAYALGSITPSRSALRATPIISTSQTITVGNAAELKAAILRIDGSILTDGAHIVIQFADGVYGSGSPASGSLLTQFFIDDPKFGRVSFRGNCGKPSAVVLNFDATNNLSGFLASDGGRIGLIDCMTINGVGARTGASDWALQAYGGGVVASGSGSIVTVGSGLTVNNFYYGVASYYRAAIFGNGTTANNSGDANFIAGWGGSLRCLGCHANTAAHVSSDKYGAVVMLGGNYISEMSGSMYIDGSTGTGARTACVIAQTDGGMWAHDVDCTSSGGAGAKVAQNGFMELYHAHLHGDDAGAQALTGGGVDISGAMIDANRGDGIIADGGRIYGSHARIANNGGFGARALHQGSIELFATFGGMTGNKGGKFVAEAAGTLNGASFAASSLLLN